MAELTEREELELLELEAREAKFKGRPIPAAARPFVGFAKGVAGLLGSPSDIVRSGLEAAGLEKPASFFRGKETFESVFGLEGIQPPQTFAERMAERVGEEVGAGLGVTAAIGPKIVQRAGRLALPTGGRLVARTGQALLQSYADSLAKMSLTRLATLETGLLALQGSTAQLGRETLEDVVGTGLADFTGQMITALGVPAALAITNKVIQGVRKVSPIPTEKAGRRQTGEALEKAGVETTRAQAGLERAEELKEAIPGFEPTTTMATQEPGMVALEKITKRLSPQVSADFEAIKAKNARAIQEHLSSIPGVEDVDPTSIRELIDKRIGNLEVGLNKALLKAEGRVNKRLEMLSPKMKASESGNIIREEILKARAEVDVKSNALFDVIDQAGTEITTVEGVREAAKEMIRGLGKGESPGNIPPVARRIIQRIGVKKVETEEGIEIVETFEESFREIHKLRSQILNDIRSGRGIAAPNPKQLRNLDILREAIDADLDQFAKLDSPAAKRYAEARDFYRTQVVERFRLGATGEVMRAGPLGAAFREEASEVAATFFHAKAGAKESMQDFIKAVGDRPKAVEALKDYAKRDMFDAVVDLDGKVNPARLSTWLKKHSEVLEIFPELRAEFRDLRKVKADADRISGTVERTRRDVDKSVAKLFLDEEPEIAIRKVLSSGNKTQRMEELVNIVKHDEAAMRALRRGVWDEVVSQTSTTFIESGDAVVNPKALSAFVNRNLGPLLKLYSREQLSKIEEISEGMGMVMQKTGGGIKLPELGGKLPQQIFGPVLARLWAIKTGRVGKIYGTSEAVARFSNRYFGTMTRDQITELLNEALVDPEVAKTLTDFARVPEQQQKVRLERHLTAIFGKRVPELVEE